MKNTLIGIAIALLALVSVPGQVDATYYYDNGYSYPSGGGYSYGNGYGYHVQNPFPTYPPAPSYYNTPTVQYVYANGYYQNYFVPTVRYFPPVQPVYQQPYYPPRYVYNPPSCFGYGQGRYCY